MRTRISSLNSFSPVAFGFCLGFFGSRSSSSSSSSSGWVSDGRLYSGGTSMRNVARASLIFVRRAFSIREWFILRCASRAARERVPGLRPRRFGVGLSSGSGGDGLGGGGSLGDESECARGRFALRGGLQEAE